MNIHSYEKMQLFVLGKPMKIPKTQTFLGVQMVLLNVPPTGQLKFFNVTKIIKF